MRESSATGPDRRQTPRTKLAEIAYIGMGPENGGLVLDVSDGGLSFHAVAPVQRSDKIQFLLSLRGHSRIEGAGEVVWTNEMRTVCGLKFISLSSGAREYLNSWTYQAKAPAAARENRPAPKPTLQPEPANVPTSLSENTAAPVFAISPAVNSPFTEPRDSSVWQEPFLLWILVVFLVCACGVAAYKYGVQVGRSEVKALAQTVVSPLTQGNSQASSPTAPPSPSAPAGTPSATEGTSPAQSGPTPFPGGNLVNASRTDNVSGSAGQAPGSEENSSSAPAQRSEQQLQAGQSELAAAKSYLSGANGNRDSVKAARLLWAAVGNGNAAAEVLLADLYVRGDGVPKNCDQGQVLLIAAVKSGNIEAQEKLKDLHDGGCK
jgi:hypothetical protein